jgi:uncharacterized protein YjbI with pentapeptide repeats
MFLTDVSYANLSGISLELAMVGDSHFEGANLSHGRFDGSWFLNTAFPQANLDHASFVNTKLNYSLFPAASMNQTDFTGAVFRMVYLRDMDLSRAILDRADFSDVAQCYPWERKNPPGC